MKIHLQLFFCLAASQLLMGSLFAQLAEKDLKPLLSPTIYAVPGVRMNVYFRNAVLCERPYDYHFKVTCPVQGTTVQGEGRWTLFLDKNHTGRFPFKLDVCAPDGKVLGETETTLVISPKDAGKGRKIKLLLIGDSLTHISSYPNRLAALLSRPGNPEWKMMGTHKPKTTWYMAREGVAYEGYGGWSWRSFVTRYKEPLDRLGPYKNRSSPFLYKNEKTGKIELSVGRYLMDNYQGEKPDFIIIMLGINGCVAGATEKNAKKNFQAEFGFADILLKELRSACPNAIIGLCVTIPPNTDELCMNGKPWDRYLWLRAQHQFIKEMITKFKGRERENIYLIPTDLNIDTYNGFPDFNKCHPNRYGYHQIAATVYSWLKAMLNKQMKDP